MSDEGDDIFNKGSTLDPEFRDPTALDEDEFPDLEEEKIQQENTQEVQEAESRVAPAMETESNSSIDTTLSPEKPDISITDRPSVESDPLSLDLDSNKDKGEIGATQTPYNVEAMGRVAEAVQGVRRWDGFNRNEFFSDLAELENPASRDEIVSELSDKYTHTEINRMIGKSNQSGILEEHHVFDREEGITDLGEDILKAIEGVGSHLEEEYAAFVDKHNYDNGVLEATERRSSEVVGPVEAAMEYGTDQDMEGWVDEAVGAGLAFLSKSRSSDRNRLLGLVAYVEENGLNNKDIAETAGFKNSGAVSAAMSMMKSHTKGPGGYLDSDGEVSKFGDVALSNILQAYENESERLEYNPKQELAKTLAQDMQWAEDPYQKEAEEIDQALQSISQEHLRTDKIAGMTKFYSQELEYSG